MTVNEYVYWQSPTDSHLAALGRIVVECAILEGVIGIAIWQLLKVPREMGEHITSRPSLRQRADLLFSITPTAFPMDSDQNALAPIKQEINALIGVRNYLVHTNWGFGTTQDRPISVNYRNEKGDFVPRMRSWRVKEIERVAARIGRVGDELIDFLETHGVELPPSPNKSWRRYQMPPEPKWPSKRKRALKRQTQP